MIAGLRSYPAYKDSGVSWLGKVPAHWEMGPLKRFVARRPGAIKAGPFGSQLTANEMMEADVKVYTQRNVIDRNLGEGSNYISNTKFEVLRAFEVFPGDVLVTSRGTIGRTMLVTEDCERGVLHPCLIRVQPDQRHLIAEFLMTLIQDSQLLSQQLVFLSNATTIDVIYSDTLANIVVPVPPLPEQTTIVRFLDHTDRRIRRYIRAKQKLIALLEEQKQDIIHQAVTGQIDVRTGQPYPSYKPSGVEWLGDVPAHWEVRRLKWVTRLQRGYDLPADQRVPGPFPVVSSSGFIGTHTASKCTGPGVVMGRYGSTDAVFYVEQDFWPHNTSLFVTHFQGNMQKWCYYLLRSISKADHAGKSAVPGLDRNDLFQIVVPVPPVDEQQEVVRTIEVATHNLDEAISAVQREIELLTEYRTRLIADVVTGKLDVREAAATLPEVDPLVAEDTLGDALNPDVESALDELATVPEEAEA